MLLRMEPIKPFGRRRAGRRSDGTKQEYCKGSQDAITAWYDKQ